MHEAATLFLRKKGLNHAFKLEGGNFKGSLIELIREYEQELSKLQQPTVSDLDACKHSFYHVENRDVVICTGCKEIIGEASDC